MKGLEDEALDEVARYFGALAASARLKILNALREGERNVGELTEIAGCTQANVSKHLAVLAEHGLVAKSPRGTSVYYRIADPRIYRICDVVCGQVGERFEQRARIARALARVPRRARAAAPAR
jgi:DNA-binding transcriptional ArsR family regulator